MSLLVFAVAGCSSSNAVALNGPRLIVSLPAAQISVARGTRTSIGAAVTREGGAQVPVTISVDTPAAVTVSVTNASTVGTTTTATLAITVSAAATQERYTIVVLGHATGYPDASAQLEIDLPNLAQP
jgi:hypothetical protein